MRVWIIYHLLLFSTLSLLTRKMVKKANETHNLNANYSTTCRNVDLKDKYNYTNVVKSGYLTVGKNSSVLSFIFYGKKG